MCVQAGSLVYTCTVKDMYWCSRLCFWSNMKPCGRINWITGICWYLLYCIYTPPPPPEKKESKSITKIAGILISEGSWRGVLGGGWGWWCEFINNLESIFLLHDILIALRNSSHFFGYRNVLHLLFRSKIENCLEKCGSWTKQIYVVVPSAF